MYLYAASGNYICAWAIHSRYRYKGDCLHTVVVCVNILVCVTLFVPTLASLLCNSELGRLIMLSGIEKCSQLADAFQIQANIAETKQMFHFFFLLVL